MAPRALDELWMRCGPQQAYAWRLTGCWDRNTVRLAWAGTLHAVRSHPTCRWVCHCEGITQADSSTLALCLAWLREAKQHGKIIVFSGMPEPMCRLASLFCLDNLL